MTISNSSNVDIAAEIAIQAEHGLVGQWTTPRRLDLTGQILTASELHLTSWIAPRTEAVTQISTWCTVASATITKQELGIYTVSDAGALTLVASTTHDAAIWQAALIYTKALTAGVTLTAGTRYALGALFVGTTAPTMVCTGTSTNDATTQTGVLTAAVKQSILFAAPWKVARVASQTTMPATVAAASVVVSTNLAGQLVARVW